MEGLEDFVEGLDDFVEGLAEFVLDEFVGGLDEFFVGGGLFLGGGLIFLGLLLGLLLQSFLAWPSLLSFLLFRFSEVSIGVSLLSAVLGSWSGRCGFLRYCCWMSLWYCC